MNVHRNDAPCVLIIAPHGSYRTFDFIQAADKLGINTLIASEGKHSVISAYAKGIHLDFKQTEQQVFSQLSSAAAQHNIVGVIATDDYTTALAARLCAQLKLPHNSLDAVQLTQRKDLARDRLAQHGVSKPRHWHLDLSQDVSAQINDIEYPAVLKPVGLSASRGVIRVNSEIELRDAIERNRRMLNAMNDLSAQVKRYLLVEEFIPGNEIAVEGMLYAGQLQLLTIFDKPDVLDGPYFEETYYITPTTLNESMQQQVCDVLQQACDAYGLSEGPIHAECRLYNNKVYIIEIAARTIGGLCARLLNVGTGYSLEEIVLSHAMGNNLQIKPQQQSAGVLMIPIPQAGILKRVEGLLAAQSVANIEEISIQIREGHELLPLPEGSSYLGFIFAFADTPKQVEQALRAAHAHLKFVVAPLWKLSHAS